jgi:leucyl-tRNA synthetase
MGKSLKNAVSPDELYESYGADTLRLYEMSMGPLGASRPWETQDVVGMYRFLQRLWRNLIDEETGELRVSDQPADDATRRLLHRTIAAVRAYMAELHFNTAIAKLIELNNHLTRVGSTSREVAEPLVLMLSPLTPHVAEELWERLGHSRSLARHAFPDADPELLVEEEIELPVQVNGRLRGRITVAADADDGTIEAAALADDKVRAAMNGAEPRKVIVVPGRMVNVVA